MFKRSQVGFSANQKKESKEFLLSEIKRNRHGKNKEMSKLISNLYDHEFKIKEWNQTSFIVDVVINCLNNLFMTENEAGIRPYDCAPMILLQVLGASMPSLNIESMNHKFIDDLVRKQFNVFQGILGNASKSHLGRRPGV